MKVLIVGFSKTGTKTMNAVLKILGYKVYDFEDNFYYLRKQWIKIMTKGGTKEDFYEMYKDVDASMDIPTVVFWEEILEAFPDCKLIFMRKKSEEEWLVSWERQVKALNTNYFMKVMMCFSPTAYSIGRYVEHVGRIVFGTPPQRFHEGYKNFSPTLAKKRYRDHNTSVLARAPKDQLLEYNFSQGWEPLCKFLGKPIPDIELPHKNKNASLLDDLLRESPIFRQMKKEMYIVVSVLVVALSVFAFYYYFAYKL